MNIWLSAIRCSLKEEKLENSLELSLLLPEVQRQKSPDLTAGYDASADLWEVIIRISGQGQPLSEIFPRGDFRELSGGYVIGRLSREDLGQLTELPQVIYVEQPKRIYGQILQGKRASCITALQQEEASVGKWTGRGVFVAILDSGIDYFHPDFCRDDGTSRIAWLYDDGVEYSNEQINRALADKKEGYALVPSRDLSGHGTHVAGIAAGNGRASGGKNRGIAYESELIIVKLGNARSGGFPKTTQLMEGMEYVKEKALAAGKPVAVNISFGNNYGSHTGTSLLESYLDQLADQWKMSIVVASGNEGVGRLHYQGKLSTPGAQWIELRIGSFETGLNLQLWKNFQDRFSAFLVAPDGQRFLLSGSGEQVQQRLWSYVWQDTQIYVFAGTAVPYSMFQEIYISFLPAGDYLDQGIWSLELIPEQIKDGSYSLWLPAGATQSEETGFLEPSPETTLTIPSTAEKVITVGAYDSRRDQYATFSGRGYPWQRQMVKPDLVAPGVDILSCAPGGGYVSYNGTSMAAPFVTGSAALLMQWGIVEGKDPFAYGEKLKAYLLLGAESLPGEPMPSPRTGWGRLCLKNSIPKG